MERRSLTASDKALLNGAKELLRAHGSEISGVSAGLRTRTGKAFFGLSVDPKPATVGMCAEYSAIGTMVTSGEHGIRTIVAVTGNPRGTYVVLSPCGKCRDFIRGFGDPYVIIQDGSGVPIKMRLKELVPVPWN